LANILITAIGSFSADIVIKTLKLQGHYLIGCDIYPKEWVADAYNVDEFYQAPFARDRVAYTNFIEKICKRHNIEYVLPLTDPEVDILSAEKELLKEKKVIVCVSDKETIKLCRDKLILPQFLIKQGIKNVIPTMLMSDIDEVQLPVFIKPISGRSSQGCRSVYDMKEFTFLKEILPCHEYIVQPLIQGSIITVDIVRDPVTDIVICIPRRELLRNNSGAGTTVEIIENCELEKNCIEIACKVGIVGAVNFEFIETGNNEFYFLEINPRFSGGLEFSHLAGYDVVNNHLKCFSKEPICQKKTIKRMIIARKYEEFITKLF
jgi:Carbamoylphosphate synthase large subunit (split gene in MJ)